MEVRDLWQRTEGELIDIAESSDDPQILLFLAQNGNSYVRLALASNPNAWEDLLYDLALTGDLLMKIEVARNENCSSELLDELALWDDIDLQETLLQHPNLSPLTERMIVRYIKQYNRAMAEA